MLNNPTSILATIALAFIAAVVVSDAADARGKGGPATQHRGCMSNNGIPLDDGQSVVVDGVTISCNNGTVCHFANGQVPLCYTNVWGAQASQAKPVKKASSGIASRR
jgi:hypothetical protein